LRLPTLADQLRRAQPRATIVSLSLKDRAALFGGGRAPTAALWFDASLGRFVTSTALAKSFPAWALPVVGPEFLRALMPRVWSLLDEKFVAAHAATPDAQPGEGEIDGWSASFPHALGSAVDPARVFRATPFGDETLLALALAAVDARDAQAPMLLALSLSSNDYIGHVFGPDSWEAWDELVRLDAALADFFAALDKRLGPRGWSLVLSGDHGVTTMPEAAERARPWCKSKSPDRWARACGDAGRILPDELAEHLRTAARRAVGDGDFIAGIADPYVYVSAAARALDGEQRRRLDDAIAAAARTWPGVAAVYDARKPPASCGDGDDVATLVCRSLVIGAPGEIYIVTRPGWFFDPDYVVGKGTSHGTPYLYDRAVPLVARAPGRVPAGRALATPLGPAAFAATAAHLLGVAPPPAARGGRDLCR
jgi:type I phosphodiesterase/nucleotide pyrophosphatase